MNSTPKSRLSKPKKIFMIIALFVFITLLFFTYNQFNKIDESITINWPILGYMVLFKIGSATAQAGYYQTIIRKYRKFKLPSVSLIKSMLVTMGINLLIPSANIVGLKYLHSSQFGKFDFSRVTLAQIVYFIYNSVALLIALVIALFLLTINSIDIDGLSFSVIYSFIIVVILAILSLLVIIFNQRIFHNLINKLSKFVSKVSKVFKFKLKPAKVSEFINDTIDHTREIIIKEKIIIQPIFYSLLNISFEVSGILLVAHSLGYPIGLEVAITAYAFALVATSGQIIANGTGPYEVAMITTLVALSVPIKFAIPITVVYRLINVWMPLIPGIIFYLKDKKHGLFTG